MKTALSRNLALVALLLWGCPAESVDASHLDSGNSSDSGDASNDGGSSDADDDNDSADANDGGDDGGYDGPVDCIPDDWPDVVTLNNPTEIEGRWNCTPTSDPYDHYDYYNFTGSQFRHSEGDWGWNNQIRGYFYLTDTPTRRLYMAGCEGFTMSDAWGYGDWIPFESAQMNQMDYRIEDSLLYLGRTRCVRE